MFQLTTSEEFYIRFLIKRKERKIILKKNLKVFLFAIALILTMALSSFTVFAKNNIAAGAIHVSSKGKSFSKSWEVTYPVKFDTDNAKFYMKYGFNTYLIDEDYVKGFNSLKPVDVKVSNTDSIKRGSSRANKQAIAEIRHKESTVIDYYMTWKTKK